MDQPLDLLIMPGLAFDSAGRRLGRGGGYYDKFIMRLLTRADQMGWDRPLLLALAYREQLVDDIPMDQHDEPVDWVITADRALRGKAAVL